MKHQPGRLFHEDNLVARWYDRKTDRTFSQGKRVAADCPMTADERKVYVNKGTSEAVVKIMRDRGLTLSEAVQIFRAARGRVRRTDRTIPI